MQLCNRLNASKVYAAMESCQVPNDAGTMAAPVPTDADTSSWTKWSEEYSKFQA